MSESKFNPRNLVLLMIILLVSIIRVAAATSVNFKELANFSAVGGIALFGGAYFNSNGKAFGFPLLVLVLSDLFIARFSGYGFFYPGWYWTYIAFIAMVLIAKLIIQKVNVQNVAISVLAGVVAHWILSDIGAMYVPGLYEPTFAGYIECLIKAVPYELQFIYGTVIYTVIMFGVYELLKAKYPLLSSDRTVVA
jgi:hypothetical protein